MLLELWLWPQGQACGDDPSSSAWPRSQKVIQLLSGYSTINLHKHPSRCERCMQRKLFWASCLDVAACIKVGLCNSSRKADRKLNHGESCSEIEWVRLCKAGHLKYLIDGLTKLRVFGKRLEVIRTLESASRVWGRHWHLIFLRRINCSDSSRGLQFTGFLNLASWQKMLANCRTIKDINCDSLNLSTSRLVGEHA